MLQLEVCVNTLQGNIQFTENNTITLQMYKIVQMQRIDENYSIKVRSRWGTLHELGNYKNKSQALNKFEKFQSYLEKGYPIQVNHDHSAKIIAPHFLQKVTSYVLSIL